MVGKAVLLRAFNFRIRRWFVPGVSKRTQRPTPWPSFFGRVRSSSQSRERRFQGSLSARTGFLRRWDRRFASLLLGEPDVESRASWFRWCCLEAFACGVLPRPFQVLFLLCLFQKPWFRFSEFVQRRFAKSCGASLENRYCTYTRQACFQSCFGVARAVNVYFAHVYMVAVEGNVGTFEGNLSRNGKLIESLICAKGWHGMFPENGKLTEGLICAKHFLWNGRLTKRFALKALVVLTNTCLGMVGVSGVPFPLAHFLEPEYFASALEPLPRTALLLFSPQRRRDTSDKACFESSPGRHNLQADWISRADSVCFFPYLHSFSGRQNNVAEQREYRCFAAELLEGVAHKRVEDAHGLLRHANFWVHLLQHLVNVDVERFLASSASLWSLAGLAHVAEFVKVACHWVRKTGNSKQDQAGSTYLWRTMWPSFAPLKSPLHRGSTTLCRATHIIYYSSLSHSDPDTFLKGFRRQNSLLDALLKACNLTIKSLCSTALQSLSWKFMFFPLASTLAEVRLCF